MRVLFFTLVDFLSESDGIYQDLAKCFLTHGHQVTVVCPAERRKARLTQMCQKKDGCEVLSVRSLNLKGNCSFLERGIGTVSLGVIFKSAICRYLEGREYDLILFSTPPVTISGIIKFAQRRFHAKSYMLLKDIMPQGAVDLGVFSRNGVLYRYFRNQEVQLFKSADFIGCMSPAQKWYVEHAETYLTDSQVVEINPNSRSPRKYQKNRDLFKKYGIPASKVIFIYGGNLGKPQGVDFLIQCLRSNEKREGAFFVVVGDGQNKSKVFDFIENECPKNSKYIAALPQSEYEELCASSDVGLIFLDPRFTVPNFPSRSLSYMQASIPYIAAVDRATDIGTIAEDNGFGLNCISGDLEAFNQHVDALLGDSGRRQKMGLKAHEFFLNHYTVEHSYKIIMKHFGGDAYV